MKSLSLDKVRRNYSVRDTIFAPAHIEISCRPSAISTPQIMIPEIGCGQGENSHSENSSEPHQIAPSTRMPQIHIEQISRPSRSSHIPSRDFRFEYHQTANLSQRILHNKTTCLVAACDSLLEPRSTLRNRTGRSNKTSKGTTIRESS